MIRALLLCACLAGCAPAWADSPLAPVTVSSSCDCTCMTGFQYCDAEVVSVMDSNPPQYQMQYCGTTETFIVDAATYQQDYAYCGACPEPEIILDDSVLP